MNAPRLTDAQVSQALRAHLPDGAQAGLRQRILEAAETTSQQRALPSFIGALNDADPVARRRSLLIAAALLVALALAATAAVGALRLLERDPIQDLSPELPTVPSPAVTTLPGPSTEPAAPTSSPRLSPPPVGQSLELTWTKVTLDQRSPQVALLGHQFGADPRLSARCSPPPMASAGTSCNRANRTQATPRCSRIEFVSWQDQVVGWWNPEDGPDIAGKPPITARDILRIVRPLALHPRTRRRSRAASNRSASGPSVSWPTSIPTSTGTSGSHPSWVAIGCRTTPASLYKNGILRVGMDNGPGLRVNWADEGFLPGDYQDLGFGWFSPDGQQWTAIPGFGEPGADGGQAFPTGLGDVVGVSDGFIVRGTNPEETCPLPTGCGRHVAFGRRPDLAQPRRSGGGLVRIGRVAVDGRRARDRRRRALRVLDLRWVQRVADCTPNSARHGNHRIRTAERNSARERSASCRSRWTTGRSSSLGTASTGASNRCPLRWRPMARRPSFSRRSLRTVAVGDRSVLVMVSGGEGEDATRSLWLGTFEP